METFFKIFDMPDTFYSWWIVTELHAWMLCVRLAVGNTKGMVCIVLLIFNLHKMFVPSKIVTVIVKDTENHFFPEASTCRNFMVTELYNDMDAKSKTVADMDRKTRRDVIWDLAEEFKVYP